MELRHLRYFVAIAEHNGLVVPLPLSSETVTVTPPVGTTSAEPLVFIAGL